MSSVRITEDVIDDVQAITVDWVKGRGFCVALTLPDTKPGLVRHQRERCFPTEEEALTTAKRWGRQIRRDCGYLPT